MDFYRTLDSSRIVWVAAGETTDVNAAYLKSHGLHPGALSSVDDLKLDRVTGTPTILMVNPNGDVLKVWRGALSASGEADVRRAIAETTARRYKSDWYGNGTRPIARIIARQIWFNPPNDLSSFGQRR
jgi:hypothetical protein